MSLFDTIFNPEIYKKYSSSRGIQNIYTPIDKIEKATNFEFTSIISSDTKEIGILFNFEFIENILKKYNKSYINITYFYDSEFDLEEAKFIAYKYNFVNITYISIEEFSNSKNIKDLEKVMTQKKFDIVFSNPPYNKNLDLKILNSLFETSENIIFIHPASWCFCRDYQHFNHLNFVYEHRYNLKELYLFWGNKLFNIGLFSSLCISYWTFTQNNNQTIVYDKAYSKENYNSILGMFSYHGSNIEANNLKIKIKEYMQTHNMSILDHNIKADYSNMTNHSVRFALLRGHSHAIDGLCEDFYSLICMNKNENKCDKNYRISNAAWKMYKNIMTLWSFNTETEQNNFINYCSTKIVRFLLTFTKTNANIIPGQVTNIIPWLDFTQEWNDAKLCKEFGISEELWKYIDNFIPDYYVDYVSGF